MIRAFGAHGHVQTFATLQIIAQLLSSPSLCEAVALLAQAPYITFAVAPHVAENLCKQQRNFTREPLVAPIKTHLTP
jgi:Sec-independent protein secretion pathway component TatC